MDGTKCLQPPYATVSPAEVRCVQNIWEFGIVAWDQFQAAGDIARRAGAGMVNLTRQFCWGKMPMGSVNVAEDSQMSQILVLRYGIGWSMRAGDGILSGFVYASRMISMHLAFCWGMLEIDGFCPTAHLCGTLGTVGHVQEASHRRSAC